MNIQKILYSSLVLGSISYSSTCIAQDKNQKSPSPIIVQANGNLSYTPDSLGNRVPDFSYAGYMARERSIPLIPVKAVVPSVNGDATEIIQSAIDYVASLPADENGFRGAVLLQNGTFRVKGQIKIKASGIVLRGSGVKNTILLGDGTDRETLIRVVGANDRKLSKQQNIIDSYVPVNANKISVPSANDFKVGDQVLIHRPSSQKWIRVLGTETFGGGISALGWKPGERDLNFDRRIVFMNGNNITLDAPITTALDSSYGVSTIASYSWPGRIQQVGIENLSCVSEYDKKNLKDEAHRWMAITMENVQDAWVRQVTFEHFAGSAVYLLESSKRITVEDCKSLSPVSEIGGQ